MARKRKASELNAPRRNGGSAHDKPKSSAASASLPADQPTVDWSTIDQRPGFDGFQLLAVKLKPKKEATTPASKKQRTAPQGRASQVFNGIPLGAEVSQENPFPETDLSPVYCKIEPAREWESTRRYRKFTIMGEAFQVNQFVFVKKDPAHNTPADIDHWVAKVLEVRAGDTQHVYLRVYWAYRPEDLHGGRQPYHGQCELIVSNHMDVIDAQCVQSAANVIYWDDSPDNSTFPAPEQLYWRQALDINKQKGPKLTKLNTYCIDKKPCNPDEPLIPCPSCSGYLHTRCLQERAVKNTHTEHKTNQSTNFFAAELSITETDQPRLQITDTRKGKTNEAWEVDIHCLLCKSLIAKANADAPTPNTPAPQIIDDDEVEEEQPPQDAAVTPEASSPSAPLAASNLAIGDIPTSASATASSAPAPATKAPRSRGRPKASDKKTRARPTHVKVKEDPLELATPPSPRITQDPAVCQAAASASATQLHATPHPASTPTPASVLQSGVRSVARLLWRA